MATSSRSSRSRHCSQRSSATRHKETPRGSDGRKRANKIEETDQSNRDKDSTSDSQRSIKSQVDSSYEYSSTNQDNSDDGWSCTSNSTNDDFPTSGQFGGYTAIESDIYGIGHWVLSPEGTWYQGGDDNGDSILGNGVEPGRVRSRVEEAIVSFEKLCLGP